MYFGSLNVALTVKSPERHRIGLPVTGGGAGCDMKGMSLSNKPSRIEGHACPLFSSIDSSVPTGNLDTTICDRTGAFYGGEKQAQFDDHQQHCEGDAGKRYRQANFFVKQVAASKRWHGLLLFLQLPQLR